MFWIKLAGSLAVLAAAVFLARIVWDAFREKPEPDEEAHLGI